jgi:hypothetical protein
VKDIFVSGYKRKDRDNEAVSSKDNEASSSTETVCEKPKWRKYDTNICFFGFTNIDNDAEGRSRYLLCMKFWLRTT